FNSCVFSFSCLSAHFIPPVLIPPPDQRAEISLFLCRCHIFAVADRIFLIHTILRDHFSTADCIDRCSFTFQTVQTGHLIFCQQVFLSALPCFLRIHNDNVTTKAEFKCTWLSIQPKYLCRIIIHDFGNQTRAESFFMYYHIKHHREEELDGVQSAP